MTTDIAQTEEKATTREPLPPVELDAALHALVEERPVTGPVATTEHTLAPTPAPKKNVARKPEEATGIAGWFVRNRWFTKEPITYIAYQFARATAATIPYGFGMAAVHHAFGMMGVKGQKMGLTQVGMDAFSTAVDASKNGFAAVEKLVTDSATAAVEAVAEAKGVEVKHLSAVEKVAAEMVGTAKVWEPGLRGSIGRTMMRLTNSPLNAAVQIAVGFTMYRFTGSVVKNVRDRIMNEKNTPEQTIAEVKHAPKTILETIKINWPAESTGTPIAALVLGFMSAAFVPSMAPIRDRTKKFINQVGELWSPKSKLLQNAGVWTASYSLFFLLAESLFRDKQLQRGHWKGHPNSLKNGPDDTVGGPGAVTYTPPGADGTPAKLVTVADTDQKVDDDLAKDSHEQLRFPGLTGEPSIGRFLIRRILPVAVGISAYAALKRVGYIASIPLPGIKHNYMADVEKNIPGALNGPMEQLSVKMTERLAVEGDKVKTVANHAKFYLKNAYREGKATAMFGALWAATDAWGTFYDKFVHNLQKPENAVPLNEHQQGKHAEMLVRLNEKDKAQGRAA